jgi:DNA repair ATPase RecN
MIVEYVGPLVAAANLIRTHVSEARKADRGTVQALMGYSAAIEEAIHALINETRTILIVSLADLDNDESMRQLKRRIETYLAVHNVYDPLKDVKVEAEMTLEILDKKAEQLLNLKDITGKKRQALLNYREAFDGVLDFIDKLENATKHLPSRTGLLADEMGKLSRIVSLERSERLKAREEVVKLVEEGLAELDDKFAGVTERLILARHQVVVAFG